MAMGHIGCDGSQASGPWAIGSGYRFSTGSGAKELLQLSLCLFRRLR